jgi:hypothetical protein
LRPRETPKLTRIDAGKNRPVFQDTTTGDKFSQPPWIRRPEFWTNLENGLGLGGKVKGIFRLVIVNPVQPEAVVEKCYRPRSPICQDAMELAIQARRERGILLTEMH